jgi:hypothetical protein
MTIVLQGIATASDQSVLGGLRRINMKTLAFRIAAVSDSGRAASGRPRTRGPRRSSHPTSPRSPTLHCDIAHSALPASCVSRRTAVGRLTRRVVQWSSR